MGIPRSYPINKIPQWDGTGAPQTPKTTPTRGFDVNAPRKHGSSRNGTYSRANGTLCTNKFKWPIFITDVSLDLSVQGSIAQSQLTRDFYPRNFVIPAFQVAGQSIDQLDYGMMCDFIHMSQKSMLSSFSSIRKQTAPLLQLQIAGRGFVGKQTRGNRVSVNNNHFTNQVIRGPHQEIQALGFVTTMPRVHEAGVPAPTWTFGFEIVAMIPNHKGESPLFLDGSPVSPAAKKTWIDMLHATKTLDTASLAAGNTKILSWAEKNSVNVISNSSG